MKTSTPTPLILDGAEGEGGGQILRSALALSAVTGTPFRLENIRAKRSRPGLMRQHLACVRAAAAVTGARVNGDALGSSTLDFAPGAVRPGAHEFAVATAGSALLVAQTVLPILVEAGESSLVLRGGTHNPLAPPFEFIDHAFLPAWRALGVSVTATLVRPGFFPAGGGEVRFAVTAPDAGAPLNLENRGALLGRSVIAHVSGIPAQVGERELELARARLGLEAAETELRVAADPTGPGNALVAVWRFAGGSAVFTALGERGKPAEVVVKELADQVERHLAGETPVDAFLADQLLLPCALRHGGSFRATGWTPHAQTNASIIQRFLPGVSITAERAGRLDWRVRVQR